MEDVAVWLIGGVVSTIGVIIAGVATYERRQRKRVEALGRRRKDRIQL